MMNKYKGRIAFHTEMCCGVWLQFHDDRGLHGDENQYWSWDWTINFNKNSKIDNIKIFDDDNNNIVYDGPWTFERGRYFGNYVYYPLELTEEQIKEYATKCYRVEIETDILVDALKEKHGT